MLLIYLSLIDNEEDKSSFTQIYNTYYQQMFYLARSITDNIDDAEDVVHNTFMIIARKHMSFIQSISNATDLRNYLLKCTKNNALNYIKSRKNHPTSIDSILEHNPDTLLLSDDTLLEAICTNYEYVQVLEAIQSLGKTYSDALYCHFVLELSIPQTAKHLNQSVEATKKQLVRGKKLLLAKLEHKI